jgi:flagellar hook-associated protein 3 FlgL
MSISSISTASLTSVLTQSVSSMQTQLAQAELEVSTGQQADLGLSLGAGIGQSISLTQQQSLLQTLTTTNNVAATRLTTTQSTLSDMQTTAQNFLNSLISNTTTQDSASILQTTAASGLQSMISDLNSTLNGAYLFAGTNTGNPPITDYFGSSAANKTAVDNAFSTAFGMSPTSTSVSSISGSAMSSFLDNQFSALFTGSNWSSDWSSASNQTLTSKISTSNTQNTSVSANAAPFQQLAEAYSMITEFGSQNLSADAYQAVMTKAQSLVSSAISGLTDIQSNVGVVQSAITGSNTQMAAQITVLSTQADNLDSVDPYAAATRVNNLQTQIETAYSLTSQLKQLSLVNYL